MFNIKNKIFFIILKAKERENNMITINYILNFDRTKK